LDSSGFLVGLGKAGHLGFSPGICSGGVSSAGLYDAGPGHRGGESHQCLESLPLMSHAFNLALKEWEWVRENPVKKVSKEKVNNQIERWLTLEEEKRLLVSSPEWL
jgi:hypothetical protein